MEYHKVTNTDLQLSRIGFGCWAIGGHGYGHVDDNVSIKAIHTALDLGIVFFDTADVYGFGHSERILQKALGKRIKDVVIGTKFGVGWDCNGRTYKDCSPKHIIKSLENSLRRLRLDVIPLYQLHWHDNSTPLEDIVRTLKKCQQDGKVKYLGCCNLSIAKLGEYQDCFVTSQLQYSLNERREFNEISNNFKNGISVLAYGVLSRGLFSGKYESKKNMSFGVNDTRKKDINFTQNFDSNMCIVKKLKILGEKYNKTPAQVALRWSLDSAGVSSALVGIKTEIQALENVGSTGWKISNTDWEWLTNDDIELSCRV